MTEPCESIRPSLGAFVLGSLPPAERQTVSRHVADCPQCRAELSELAPLPGLLNLVRADDLAARDDAGRPPDRLWESLVAAAAAEETAPPGVAGDAPSRDPAPVAGIAGGRRSWLVGAIAVAASAIVGLAIWVAVELTGTSGDAGSDAVTVSATDMATQVAATVDLIPAADGTDVAVELTGVPSGAECDLVVVSIDGQEEVAAAWTADYAGTAEVTGHVRFGADDIDRLDVTTDAGVLLTVPLR